MNCAGLLEGSGGGGLESDSSGGEDEDDEVERYLCAQINEAQWK